MSPARLARMGNAPVITPAYPCEQNEAALGGGDLLEASSPDVIPDIAEYDGGEKLGP